MSSCDAFPMPGLLHGSFREAFWGTLCVGEVHGRAQAYCV